MHAWNKLLCMLSILICYIHAEVAGVRFDRLKKAYEDPMTEVIIIQ